MAYLTSTYRSITLRIAVITGNTLLVANAANNNIRAFNAATGASAAFLSPTGLSYPYALTLAGTTLYVANVGTGIYTGTVNAYNAATGLPVVGFSAPSGLGFPSGLAVYGNILFVSDPNHYRVGAYNATTGAVLNANFIAGSATFFPRGLAILGNQLLVANANASSGSIGAYGLPATVAAGVGPTSTNANFITGLGAPQFLVVVPEPSTWAAVAAGVGLLSVVTHRRADRA